MVAEGRNGLDAVTPITPLHEKRPGDGDRQQTKSHVRLRRTPRRELDDQEDRQAESHNQDTPPHDLSLPRPFPQPPLGGTADLTSPVPKDSILHDADGNDDCTERDESEQGHTPRLRPLTKARAEAAGGDWFTGPWITIAPFDHPPPPLVGTGFGRRMGQLRS